jgi:hypothetical protein
LICRKQIAEISTGAVTVACGAQALRLIRLANFHRDCRTIVMGKEQRSNKEKRKPKADKAKPAAAGSAFPTAPGMGKGKSSAPPKK